MPDIQPWEQQPDEPNYWYRIFQRYRMQTINEGKVRSVLGLYNQDRAKRGKEPAKAIPGPWRKMKQQWRWEERAALWDKHLTKQVDDDFEADRRKAREARQGTIKALTGLTNQLIAVQGKISKILTDRAMAAGPNPDAIELPTDPGDLATIIRASEALLRMSRLEFGEPTEITDVQSQGQPIGAIDVMVKVQRAREQMQAYEQGLLDEPE